MKKLILMAAMVSSLAVVSCKKDAPAPPTPAEAPADAPPLPEATTDAAPPPPTVPESPTAKTETGTSVTVGKEGVDVQSKTVTKDTKVAVDKKGVSVEVKK